MTIEESLSAENPVRVLLVDDQVLYREGLRELIRRWPEFSVIGEASNGKEAVGFCRTHSLDLVLMDVQMPVMDGVEAAGVICKENPELSVVMLTVAADDEYLFGALYNGAQGYILKDMPSRQLRNRLQGVVRGEAALPLRHGFSRSLPLEARGRCTVQNRTRRTFARSSPSGTSES